MTRNQHIGCLLVALMAGTAAMAQQTDDEPLPLEGQARPGEAQQAEPQQQVAPGTEVAAEEPAPEGVPLFADLEPLDAESAGFDAEADEQITYIRDDPATVSISIGRIDTAALAEADDLVLDLPGDEPALDLGTVTIEPAYGEAMSLTARDGDETSSFIIDGEDVVGTIRRDARTFRVVPLGGGQHALVEVDFADVPDHPPGFDEEELPIGQPPPEDLEEMDESGLEDTGAVIDILVAYTNQARVAAGNIDALIALAVQESNQSFTNSGINTRLRLVDSYQTNYTESGNMTLDRDRFRTPGDGFMDEVHQRRNTSRADLAMLLTATGSGCGIASAILATDALAFAVTREGCATGNFTFVHEFGHLLGARHNPEQDGSTAPFAYGHGFCNDPANWRTIMSYNTNSRCPTRIQWWSGPNARFNNQATGDASQRDNVRVLNTTAPLIANFRVTEAVPCRAGFVLAGPRLCISVNLQSAQTYANADTLCRDIGARVADYGDLRYLYVRTGLDAAFNANGRWIGNVVGDDRVLCGNRNISADNHPDIANFEGTCNRFDQRSYWCAYER
jgi:hypothetical protein